MVTLEEVCNEFNDGLVQPAAIRRFLGHAWNKWSVRPRYVVLAGNGTYDNRNRKGRNDNLVPTLLTRTEFGLAGTDISYGDLKRADGLPEAAVGRLTATTAGQLATMVEKMLAHEARLDGKWAYDAAFVSDAPDEGGDFPADCEAVRDRYFRPARSCHLSLESMELTELRAALQDAFQDGSRLIAYLGHGGFDRLGRQGILTSADVPALDNAPRLPVLFFGTCVAGDYTEPGRDNLAEKLLLDPDGGAVALWAPSTLGYNEVSKLLLDQFCGAAAGKPMRLGDAVITALEGYRKAALKTGLDTGEPRIYNILGDPATRLAEPPANKPRPTGGAVQGGILPGTK